MMKNGKLLVRGGAATRCSACGGEMRIRVSTRKNPYHYEESGLNDVFLIGVKTLVCRDCGEEAVEIPRVGELHRTIAHVLFHKSGLLTGTEIRFLRKNAGLRAKDLAAFIGIEPETLSRAENGKKRLGEAADKLMRLVALAPCAETVEFQRFLLSKTGTGTVTNAERRFKLIESGWAEAA